MPHLQAPLSLSTPYLGLWHVGGGRTFQACIQNLIQTEGRGGLGNSNPTSFSVSLQSRMRVVRHGPLLAASQRQKTIDWKRWCHRYHFMQLKWAWLLMHALPDQASPVCMHQTQHLGGILAVLTSL